MNSTIFLLKKSFEKKGGEAYIHKRSRECRKFPHFAFTIPLTLPLPFAKSNLQIKKGRSHLFTKKNGKMKLSLTMLATFQKKTKKAFCRLSKYSFFFVCNFFVVCFSKKESIIWGDQQQLEGGKL